MKINLEKLHDAGVALEKEISNDPRMSGEVKKPRINLKEEFEAGAKAYDEALVKDPGLKRELEVKDQILRDKEEAKRKEEYEKEKSKKKLKKKMRSRPRSGWF